MCTFIFQCNAGGVVSILAYPVDGLPLGKNVLNHSSEIQRIVNQLGTPQDTTELRQQLQQKQQNVNHLAKETDRCVKEFGSLPVTTEQRQRKIQKDRLINDFSNALANFQKAQRQAAQKEKEFVARVRAESRVSGGFPDDSFGGNGNPFESGGQAQVQSQSQEVAITEEDLQLIQERETSIRQLESDITDINEIFKDLGMMVHEQGDMIDSIEAHVETADLHVQNATQQLAQAADYQRKSRKKICILIVVLVVLAVVVGLIIWASVKG
uniref:Syntaxin-7 n=1 Tax=Oncorhynchus tshawytscha TaxID=74940 RepID=A0AAZ3NT65_ONCTS